jgi:hypothetical protein
MRARAIAAVLVAVASASPAAASPRVHAGPALALDPAFAAITAGADWCFTPRFAAGLLYAQTIPNAGDQRAIETGALFVDAVARLRVAGGPRLRVELLGGGGLARVRYGSPGAHTELAPDVAIGAAIGVALAFGLELASEVTTHVTFGERTGTRNPAHTSELVALLLRWGPSPSP